MTFRTYRTQQRAHCTRAAHDAHCARLKGTACQEFGYNTTDSQDHGNGSWWGPGAGGPGLPGELEYDGKVHFSP